MREPLWSEIQDTIEISDQTSDQEKFNILLSNVFVAPKVGNFLRKALSIRKFLLSKPKSDLPSSSTNKCETINIRRGALGCPGVGGCIGLLGGVCGTGALPLARNNFVSFYKFTLYF